MKKEPAPPLKTKEIKKEIPKEPPKEEPPPKAQAPQTEPDFQPDKSEPTPDSPAAGAALPSGKGAGETAKGAGKDEKKPGSSKGQERFWRFPSIPVQEKKELPAREGRSRQGSLAEKAATREASPIGSSISAVDPVLLQIMRRIEEAKRYPRAARRMGIEGKTVVRFKLKPGGQVEAVEVAESSGSDILDKASVETVREAAPFPIKRAG